MPPHFIYTSSAGTEFHVCNIFIENQTMIVAKDCVTVIEYFSFILFTVYAITILCLRGTAYFCYSLIFSSALLLSIFRCCSSYSWKGFYEVVELSSS